MGVRPELTAELYRQLLLPRVIEHKMLSLLRRGQLAKWFSGIGQEAVSVGLVTALRNDDWILPAHRNLGVFTGREMDLTRLFQQLLGRGGGWTGGRDRSFHFGAPEHHIVGMISHVGAMLPVADGLALAALLDGSDRIAAVITGDGATSEGDVHEAMNLAAVWKLPVIFVIENNHWGLSTPTEEQYACTSLVDRAPGYGMVGELVDGNDLLAVRAAVGRAAEHARAGHGPVLLECETYRMRGHEETSGTAYMPEDELAEWSERDPLARFERALDAEGALGSDQRQQLRAELQTLVDAAVQDALAAPAPASEPEAELAAVYAPAAPDPAPEPEAPTGLPAQSAAQTELRYLDAITDGLLTGMRADKRVVLMGQDIAGYGGVFKVTEGFMDELGAERVRNTPIIESAALGAALGLALEGFLPVVELQFGDFASCGYNQIVNNLATTHYRWGAEVPVVVRAPVGGGVGAGPFHSQNIETYFAPVAGLKVVAPATPADAKGLLLAALGDPNPVLYLEHKWLYRNVSGLVPTGWHTVPIGQGRIARPGTEASVITYGVGVPWALEAAEALAAEGRDVEVVDLRSLRPWDRDLVLDSVRRTSRALVLHEAPQSGGFGAEVAAVVADEAFDCLDAPVRRLGGLDTPIPFARSMEAAWSPKDRILPALRGLLAW